MKRKGAGCADAAPSWPNTACTDEAGADPARHDAEARTDPARHDAEARTDPARHDAEARTDPARHDADEQLVEHGMRRPAPEARGGP
ncbi:hypothetical protein ACFWH0_15530, partial [Streptomyces coeruleorubidus]